MGERTGMDGNRRKGCSMKLMNSSETGRAAEEALKTAKNCRHYAMCKVDFLGSGVCESGLHKQFVSYYPEGRMDLFAALSEKSIPVTSRCVEIAQDCKLCARCDCQCYFVNEMRPSKVMKALKDYIGAYFKSGGEVVRTEEDLILTELKRIVGDFWADNDPAIQIAYHHDLCPHVEYKMPAYVVMPSTKEEISAVIKLLNAGGVPYVVRGNGASSHGLVFTEGAVLDLGRMKTMDFDEKNWFVKVGAGVSAFELQREAAKRGYRVHTAEPSALVCANIMTSGLLSTFSTAYGVSADNFINAEFVARDGTFFHLNDMHAPNLFAFRNTYSERDAMAVCVSVDMKLHPVTDDEEGILVPFEALEKALDFARDCAVRRIGLSIGVLGSEFLSSFMAPTKKLAAEAKELFADKLGMRYVVLLIGDSYARRAVAGMGVPVIDQKLFKTMYQALPSLHSSGWLDLLGELSDDEPFSYLRLRSFGELAETALAPSPALMVRDLDPELRPFFECLYARPEMSDLAWLNTFRIQSSRYCREKPCVALVCYLPIDDSLIEEIQNGLRDIAEKYRLESEFGFLTPIDSGKRCVWEYDFFFDCNDPDGTESIQKASREAGGLLDTYSEKTGTIRQLRYVANQGCCRKENLLYL
jgi:hypothetical protein